MINAQGSCQGAGSGEFHTYRNGRRKEFARLDELEKKEKEEIEQREFELKVAQKKFVTELRTQKNAEKRKKLKEKKLNRKRKYLESHPKGEGRGNGEGKESDEEEGSEEEVENAKITSEGETRTEDMQKKNVDDCTLGGDKSVVLEEKNIDPKPRDDSVTEK